MSMLVQVIKSSVEWYIALTKKTNHGRIIIYGLVLSGICVASPWWQPAVSAAFGKYLGISWIPDANEWAGVAIFFLVAVYSISITIIERTATREELIFKRKSDAKIVREIENACTSSDFVSIIQFIDSHHRYFWSSARKLIRVKEIFDDPSNHFLIEDLQSVGAKLNSCLNNVLNFLATHFFDDSPPGVDDSFLTMYPELNMDRRGRGTDEERQLYNKYVTELYSNTESLLLAHREFRRTARSVLGSEIDQG